MRQSQRLSPLCTRGPERWGLRRCMLGYVEVTEILRGVEKDANSVQMQSCDPHAFAVTLSVQGAVIKVWCGSCRREARDLEAIQRYFEPL